MATIPKKVRNLRRKDERPQEILDAALQEFAMNGFASAKLDDVAERAGISKGTIYLYFSCKEDLFKAMVKNKIVSILQDAEEQVALHRGAQEELIRQMLKNIIKHFENDELVHITRLIISEGSRFPDLKEFYYHEVIKRGMELARTIIARGIECGEFRKSAIIEFPHLLQSPIMISFLWKSLFDEHKDMDMNALTDAHLDILFYGLRKIN